MDERFGTAKISLFLQIEQNPGAFPKDVAAALAKLGIRFRSIVQPNAKAAPCTRANLERAIARHATALFGMRTLLLETPGQSLHGPVSWARVVTSAYAGRSAKTLAKGEARDRWPARIEVFWALPRASKIVTRRRLDDFVARLGRVLPVRVAAAGLTFAILERPMMKDARAANAAFGEALLALPNAHANHYAALDTRERALEPSWWMFLGARHLARLRDGKRRLSPFHPRAVASGLSVVVSDRPAIAFDATALRAQASLAAKLGPLYPPLVVADATHSPKTKLPDGTRLTIRRWMARYGDSRLLRVLR